MVMGKQSLGYLQSQKPLPFPNLHFLTYCHTSEVIQQGQCTLAQKAEVICWTTGCCVLLGTIPLLEEAKNI